MRLIGTLSLTSSAVLAICLLPGCASYQAKSLAPSESAAAISARSLDDAGLRDFIARHPPERKAKSGGWGLGELTLAALYFHPDLATARAEFKLALAGEKEAGELPNPVANLGLGYNATSMGISPWILTTALDIPVELAGKRSLRRKEAGHRSEASRWRLAATGWAARSRVRESMLSLYSAQRTKAVLEQQEKLNAEVASLVEEKRKAGEASAFEASQARLGLSQTRLALHQAERLAEVARVQLAAAVGISAAAMESIPLDFAAFQKQGTGLRQGESRRWAVTNRADILAALEDYEAAQSALHLEIANQYPDLNLGPGYELDQTDNKWNVGVSMELPVMNQHQGKIAKANAERELAAAKFLQVQAAALAEIDKAEIDLKGARETAKAASGILDEVKKAEATTQKMKDAGAIEKHELLQRELEVSSSKLALIEAETSQQQAVGVLEDALQLPSTLKTEIIFQPAHQP
ncbi:MAG: TolC family protein [Verrucomicrobiales bacterium]